MNKTEVIARLCALVSDVGNARFENDCKDCFCGLNTLDGDNPVVSAKVIEFIETSVHNAMNKS